MSDYAFKENAKLILLC